MKAITLYGKDFLIVGISGDLHVHRHTGGDADHDTFDKEKALTPNGEPIIVRWEEEKNV